MQLAVEVFVGEQDVLLDKDELRAGVVEVCSNGTYSVVCSDESWDERDASVVCRQLGYSPYGATVAHNFLVAAEPTIHSVECVGNESSFFECSYISYPQPCGQNQYAGVVCQCMLITSFSFSFPLPPFPISFLLSFLSLFPPSDSFPLLPHSCFLLPPSLPSFLPLFLSTQHHPHQREGVAVEM